MYLQFESGYKNNINSNSVSFFYKYNVSWSSGQVSVYLVNDGRSSIRPNQIFLRRWSKPELGNSVIMVIGTIKWILDSSECIHLTALSVFSILDRGATACTVMKNNFFGFMIRKRAPETISKWWLYYIIEENRRLCRHNLLRCSWKYPWRSSLSFFESEDRTRWKARIMSKYRFSKSERYEEPLRAVSRFAFNM